MSTLYRIDDAEYFRARSRRILADYRQRRAKRRKARQFVFWTLAMGFVAGCVAMWLLLAVRP